MQDNSPTPPTPHLCCYQSLLSILHFQKSLSKSSEWTLLCLCLGDFFSSQCFPQLQFLLQLRNNLSCIQNVYCHDPQFNEKHIKYLIKSGISIPKTLFSSHFFSKVSKNTLFYMPRCPMPLYCQLVLDFFQSKITYPLIILGNDLKTLTKTMKKLSHCSLCNQLLIEKTFKPSPADIQILEQFVLKVQTSHIGDLGTYPLYCNIFVHSEL